MKVLPHVFRRSVEAPSDEVVVVELPSGHHPADLAAMQQALDTPLARGQVRLIVDVSHADFLCSTAIGYLVYCIKRARDFGGDVRFFGPPAQPGGYFHRVVDLCGVAAIFRTYSDREGAAQSFRAAKP